MPGWEKLVSLRFDVTLPFYYTKNLHSIFSNLNYGITKELILLLLEFAHGGSVTVIVGIAEATLQIAKDKIVLIL